MLARVAKCCLDAGCSYANRTRRYRYKIHTRDTQWLAECVKGWVSDWRTEWVADWWRHSLRDYQGVSQRVRAGLDKYLRKAALALSWKKERVKMMRWITKINTNTKILLGRVQGGRGNTRFKSRGLIGLLCNSKILTDKSLSLRSSRCLWQLSDKVLTKEKKRERAGEREGEREEEKDRQRGIGRGAPM